MNKSKRIAISLVAGVLAALLCMVYGSSIRSQAEQVQAETLAKYGGDRVEVCVAARDIDVGETLDETNVITQEWLTSLLPRDAATELRQARGDVTTSRIPKNAVICNVYTKAESHKLEVPKGKVAVSVAVDAEHSVGGATGVGSYVDVYVQKDGVTDRLCGAYVIDTSEDSGATREGKIEWVTLAADLDGLVSMARAFPSRRGAAIIAASLFDTEDVRKTVARLTAEGRVSRVVVLIEALDPSDIEGLFRAGATEVIAAHSICGNGRAGEGAVDSDRRMTIEPDAFVDREPGAPRATRGPRVDDYGKAEAEHGRRPRNPLVYDDAGGPAQHAGDYPAVDMGYVHGVNLADELDEVEGFAGCGELSLMQHEQIAQNEPASQTEQAAMPAWTQRVVAAGETGTLSPTPAPPPPMPPADAAAPPHRAPVICAISGSGGCGKSTIVATMAHTSSLLGLRAAVLDLDLMFGNLYDLLGVDAPRDMAALIEPSAAGALTEPDIVATSMRVAPGVTLWGPVAAPEQAELMARPVELLLDVLRRESDVVFIDTSVFWGDAVAAAVAASDRCLVVGDAAVSSATSASRVIELASRVGVPRTRMSAVFNRFGARGADEDVAMRFEIACALSSKIRIADGGQDLAALMAFGRADEAVGQTSAFATSVREATREMLVELGCAVGPWSDMVADRATRTERPRIRLPWSREGDQR